MIAPRSQRVMFVDDEEGVRLSWNRFLSERGFDVTTVEDGDHAIKRLSETPVDVVVSDLRMPGIDGLQLLEWLRQSQPDTRFILLTGFGDDDVERKARQLGAYSYLSKPISPEALSAVITTALHLEKIQAKAAASTLTEATAQTLETGIAVVDRAAKIANRTRFATLAQALGGLILAPILGLMFVLFLPVVGFGMLLKVMLERLRK